MSDCPQLLAVRLIQHVPGWLSQAHVHSPSSWVHQCILYGWKLLQDPMLAPARYLTELVQDVFGAQLAEPIFPADEPATLRLLCEASSFSSIEVTPVTAADFCPVSRISQGEP